MKALVKTLTGKEVCVCVGGWVSNNWFITTATPEDGGTREDTDGERGVCVCVCEW